MAAENAALEFDLKNVWIVVKEASLKWKLLGIALGVKHLDLETIDRNCLRKGEGIDECLLALLDHWIKSDADASWDRLLHALENTPGQAPLARKVTANVFPGRAVSVEPSPSGQELQHLQEMFATTMASLLVILSNLRLNVSQVAFFTSNLPIFSDRHEPVVKDLHPELEDATTFNKLWWIVNKCCPRFEDYYLPRRIVEAFGSPEAKRVMTTFVIAVERFKSLTGVGEYASICEASGKEPVASSDGLVTAKFAKPYNALKDACSVVRRGFNIVPYAMSLCRGRRSSVWLDWAVSKELVPQLRRIAHEKVEFFIQNGIFAMEIDSVKIFDVSDVVPLPLLSLYKWGLVDAVLQRIHTLPKEALDRELQETDEDGKTILHRACIDGQTEVCIEVLSAAGANNSRNLLWRLDTSRRTAVHYACKKQHLELIKKLFQQGEYTVPLEVNRKHDLLQDALQNPNQAKAREIAREVVHNSKGNPINLFGEKTMFGNLPIPVASLQEAIPIFVMGDSGSGKSTLIRSLQIEKYRKLVKHLLAHVRKVDKHRAGIIPTLFESTKFGRMVFFDMAGHREYAADALLQYGYLESALFIIVVNLQDEIVDIIKQLKYWLKFIRYHYSKSHSSATLRPSVVVIGSHLHCIKLGRAGNSERFWYAYHQAVQNEPYFNFVTKVAMDCRNSTLLLVQLRWTMYYAMWELRARRAIHLLPSGCYILYGILQQFCTKETGYAITVSQLAKELSTKTQHQYHLIDHSTDSLLSLIQPLHMLNVLVLLKDSKDLGKSWVVFECKPLLSDIERAIFSSERKVITKHSPLDPQPATLVEQKDSLSNEQNDENHAKLKAMAGYIYNEMITAYDKTKSSSTTIAEIVGKPVAANAPTLTEDQAVAVAEKLQEEHLVEFVGNQATPENKRIKLVTKLDSCSLDSVDSGFLETWSSLETLSSTSGEGKTSMVGSIAKLKGSIETLDEYARVEEISDELELGEEGVAYHTGVRSEEEIISSLQRLKDRVHPSNQLMLKLMLHFKFCDRVCWAGADGKKTEYYFFPHLLPNPKPREEIGKWNRNSCHMLAWVFFPDKNKGKYEFFMPHMIHQLLLEMSKFAYGHQSTQMLRTLWWIDKTSGVEVVLNIHDNQAIILNTRPRRKEQEMDCLKVRNILVEKIRSFLMKMEGIEQLDIHESLIPSNQRRVVFPVLNPMSGDVHSCDLCDVKLAIQTQSPTIGTVTRYSISDLLLFEPYHQVPEDMRIWLKKESEQSTQVSAIMFRELTRKMDNIQLGYMVELVQSMASSVNRLKADEMRKNRHSVSQWVEELHLNFSQLQHAFDSVSIIKLQDIC